MMRTPLKINTVIKDPSGSEFVIRDVFGCGGMGYVYSTEKNGKYYALKELYPAELEYELTREKNALSLKQEFSGFSETWEWYKENAIREGELCCAAAQSRSDHSTNNNDPFFFTCLDTFEENGTVYSLFDTYEGQTLDSFVKEYHEKRLISPDEYLKTILSSLVIAAKKLDFIHRNANLLHLDLSPNNIFLVDHGGSLVNSTAPIIPYILDFGSAYSFNDTNEKNHRFSVTGDFSAPEIYRRSQGQTAKISFDADTYSLTAILFYALYGKTFDENCILDLEPWKKKFLEYKAGDILISIIEKGMSSKGNRYQNAEDFACALLDLRSYLTNNNKDLEAVLDYVFSEISEIKHSLSDMKEKFIGIEGRITGIEEILKPDTLEGQISILFNHLDALLDIRIPDHKTHGATKNIPVTFPAFISMCRCNGENTSLIANENIDHLILPETYNDDQNTAFLIMQSVEEHQNNPLLKAVNEKYKFIYDSNHSEKICLKRKTWLDKKDHNAKEYINAVEFAYNAYKAEKHEDYNAPFKISLNYTASYAVASLVWNNFCNSNYETTADAFFEKVETLIRTHNHKEDYLYTLFERSKDTNVFWFDPKNDFLFEKIFSLIERHFDDLVNTDCANSTLGKRLVEWMDSSGKSPEEVLKKSFHLIENHHCFDPDIWNRLLCNSIYAESLKVFLLNHILPKKQLNAEEKEIDLKTKISFISLFARAGANIKLQLIPNRKKSLFQDPNMKDYVSTFQDFVKSMVSFVVDFPSHKNERDYNIPTICQALSFVLIYLCIENKDFVESLKRLETSQQGKKVHTRILSAIGDDASSPFFLKIEEMRIFLKEKSSVENAFGLSDLGNAININTVKFFIDDSNFSSQDSDLFNQCYAKLLDSALKNKNQIRTIYYPCLIMPKAWCFSEENITKSKKVLEEVLFSRERLYENLDSSPIQNIIKYIGKAYTREEIRQNDAKIHHFIYDSLLLGMNLKEKPETICKIAGLLFRKRLVDYNVIIEELKKEGQKKTPESPYSTFFGDFLEAVRNFYSYERIYLFDFVKKLLNPEVFLHLQKPMCDHILSFCNKKKEYEKSLSTLQAYYLEEYDKAKNQGEQKFKFFLKNTSFITILLKIKTSNALPDSPFFDLIESIANDFKNGWEEYAITSTFQPQFTWHLIESSYERAPETITYIAANALRSCIGTFYSVFNGKVKESDAKSWERRKKILPSFLKVPSLKPLAVFYSKRMVNDCFLTNYDKAFEVCRQQQGDLLQTVQHLSMEKSSLPTKTLSIHDFVFKENHFSAEDDTELKEKFKRIEINSVIDVSDRVVVFENKEGLHLLVDGIGTINFLLKRAWMHPYLTVKVSVLKPDLSEPPFPLQKKNPYFSLREQEAGKILAEKSDPKFDLLLQIQEKHLALIEKLEFFEKKNVFFLKHSKKNSAILLSAKFAKEHSFQPKEDFSDILNHINTLISFYNEYQAPYSWLKKNATGDAAYCLDGMLHYYNKTLKDLEQLKEK